ncbi:hypothetical protein [Ligilactobacillus animalis]|uniref:hypothetical protein n=1 Tax=Ligilactobacillus animalis TaxID=1605 RepID=UPI00241D3494|nr:hypothetical protein [Ligilactobacillus animalis]MDO5883872.1 hypothetical protein [Ligilactobacillus animalis]MDU3187252.1 hypothetical protein [Ligilactobacillus animalis]
MLYEVKFTDGSVVHFEAEFGQRTDTIKYLDENNNEVPYSKIFGKQYEYRKRLDKKNG